MINKADMRDDPLNDEIGLMIVKLTSLEKWTKEKYALKDLLAKTMKKEGYTSFLGHYARYNLHRIGTSYLYQVPMNKRGHLRTFRGKTIRLVCMGHSRFDRKIMAGAVK